MQRWSGRREAAHGCGNNHRNLARLVARITVDAGVPLAAPPILLGLALHRWRIRVFDFANAAIKVSFSLASVPGFRGVGTVYRSGGGIGASEMGGATGAGDDGAGVGVGLRAGVAMARGGGGVGVIFARISLLEVFSISIWCTVWS
jgi:hypothetical protein